jgi:hypothetical protein
MDCVATRSKGYVFAFAFGRTTAPTMSAIPLDVCPFRPGLAPVAGCPRRSPRACAAPLTPPESVGLSSCVLMSPGYPAPPGSRPAGHVAGIGSSWRWSRAGGCGSQNLRRRALRSRSPARQMAASARHPPATDGQGAAVPSQTFGRSCDQEVHHQNVDTMLRLTNSCQSAFVRLPAGGGRERGSRDGFRLTARVRGGRRWPGLGCRSSGSSSAPSRLGAFSTGRGLGDDGHGVPLAVRRLALASGRDPLAPAEPRHRRVRCPACAPDCGSTGTLMTAATANPTHVEPVRSVPRGCACAGERCHNLVDPSTMRRESGPESLWVMTRRRRAFPLGPVLANDLGVLVACPGIPVHTLRRDALGRLARARRRKGGFAPRPAGAEPGCRSPVEPRERQPVVPQRADDHHDSARRGNQPGATSQSQAVAVALRAGMI